MKIVHTDNNRWIYAETGLPVSSSHGDDVEWESNGPPKDIIANPNFGGVTETDGPVSPGPNTPNNPFFGKEVVPGGQFLGVILGTLGFARANRLMNDSHFTAAKAFLTAQGVLVNPDDRQGQFLGLVQYVTTTNGDDGAVLVTAQEIAGIRATMK